PIASASELHSFSLMLRQSVRRASFSSDLEKSCFRVSTSAGSIKWNALGEFLKANSASSVPFWLLAQLTIRTPSAFFNIALSSSLLNLSGPKFALSPTSLNITFTRVSSWGNSKAVVRPLFPPAIFSVALSPNCENVFLIMYAPTSSATVKSTTFSPSLARQYATFTALPPLTSIVWISLTLPPPLPAFSRRASKSFSFDSSLIIRSTKKYGITTIDQTKLSCFCFSIIPTAGQNGRVVFGYCEKEKVGDLLHVHAAANSSHAPAWRAVWASGLACGD